jgi:hypothetical protein
MERGREMIVRVGKTERPSVNVPSPRLGLDHDKSILVNLLFFSGF